MIAKLHKVKDCYFYFFCPGCKSIHQVTDKIWTVDEAAITIRASVLVQSPDHIKDPRRCHSFVTDGKIRFLGDCSHDLKNQTVNLPEFEMFEDGSFIDPYYKKGE